MFFEKWRDFFFKGLIDKRSQVVANHLDSAEQSLINWFELSYNLPTLNARVINLNSLGAIDYYLTQDQFNFLLISSFDSLINKYKPHMTTVVSHFESDLGQEQKSLEWLKTSLMVYKNAIEECLQKNNLIFQAKIFFGLHPQKNSDLFKLRSFNLDIEFLFLKNGKLKVVVFDDPTCLFNTELIPKLNSEFILLKPQVYDELIKLLGQISSFACQLRS